MPCTLPGKTLALRFHNTSIRPWRFCKDPSRGIHSGYRQGRLVTQGRTGLVDALIEPGQSILLNLSLPSLPSPGEYLLVMDLVKEDACWFECSGCLPFRVKLKVQ